LIRPWSSRCPLRAAAVGDARRLHHRGVVAHVVDDAHEAVVEHREGLVEDLLDRLDGGAAGRGGGGPELVDLGALRVREPPAAASPEVIRSCASIVVISGSRAGMVTGAKDGARSVEPAGETVAPSSARFVPPS
jgi:hypothetical protein